MTEHFDFGLDRKKLKLIYVQNVYVFKINLLFKCNEVAVICVMGYIPIYYLQDEHSLVPDSYSLDIHGYILVYSVTSRKRYLEET